MEERIGYIDSLKGLAILLMVMGHVIARQFPDWQIALYDSPRNTMLLWRYIYSFHMPLLMFCSGLFALRINEYTWKAIGTTIWKRVLTLLVPFFASGTIKYFICDNQFSGYWFLWMLFWFIIVVLAIDGSSTLLPKYGREVSTCMIIISALLVHAFYDKYVKYEQLPFWDLGHMNMYPYFCMGVICARYDLCSKWFSRNWVYTCALLIFGFLTYWMTVQGNHIPKQSLTGSLLPISAIIMLVYFFKEGVCETCKPVLWLQELGRHSLEIYIIHVFFLFKMLTIGEHVASLTNTNGGGGAIFFVQLISSFVVAVVIIVLCYIVMNIINNSKILSLVLLGRKCKKI